MLSSCQPSTPDRNLRIALSWATDNYVNWIHRADSTVEVIDLKTMSVDSALTVLGTCDGIIMTGGDDVDPARYGKTADSARCSTNPQRDTLEFALIGEAVKLKMPVLGICRGQQILNVAAGGTLIVDIPSDHKGSVTHQCEDYLKCYHDVQIVNDSRLHGIVKVGSGQVTSNHHQAIEKLASGFTAVAWSADSIIEAIEYTDRDKMPYLLAMQWHPERMNTASPMSMPLMRSFLDACKTSVKMRR